MTTNNSTQVLILLPKNGVILNKLNELIKMIDKKEIASIYIV